MHRKKILFIINSGLVNAGVPKVVYDIISGLHQHYDFDILVQSDRKEYYDDILLSLGCNIIYFGKPLHGRKLYIDDLTGRIIRLIRFLKKGRYDVIQSFTGHQAGADCLAGAISGVKIRIANIHGIAPHNSTLLTGSYEKICRFLIRKFATKRIGVSEEAALSLYKGMDYSVIYNSVPFDDFTGLHKEEHKGINLLQIGYFNENKNQLFSLHLLHLLLKGGKDINLYFIGYDNGCGYYNKMLKFIEENRLSNNIIFLKHDFDKKQIFPIIDYVLQPSLHEGLPLTALESQAASIPCISSEAIPDMVNIGFLHKFALADVPQWISYISNRDGSSDYFDSNKADVFSRENFLSSFDFLYK